MIFCLISSVPFTCSTVTNYYYKRVQLRYVTIYTAGVRKQKHTYVEKKKLHREKIGILTYEVRWIVMGCYRHTDVAEEIYHFIGVSEVRSL